VAVLSRIHVGFDLELHQRIDRGLDHDIAAVRKIGNLGIVVEAIEDEVIHVRAGSVGDKRAAVLGAIAGLSGLIASARLGYADGKLGEVQIVTSVQRQLRDGLRLDHLADRGVAAFEQWRSCGDFYGFRYVADLEVEIDARNLLHFQGDVLHFLFEAGNVNRYLILAGREQRLGIIALRTGGDVPNGIGIDVADFDGGARNHAGARIHDAARNFTGFLRAAGE
jgi:hypothetical protein